MKGSNTANQVGVYGVQGVEDPSNVPGARMIWCRWKDTYGNFWMYGGGNFTNTYNDMWRFNPTTNNWTWMSGSQTPNINGVYGTRCVTMPTNMPGSRLENRVAWTLNGNLWMFGGARGSGLTPAWNDLWMYCISTNQWTWVTGDNTQNPTGSWGTINVPNITNKPNGRGGNVCWTDNNGHLYFFGGYLAYNDLWVFSIDPNCSSPCPLINSPLVVNASNNITLCAGDCGSISATANGGATPYTYSWTPNVGSGPGPYQVCPTSTTTYYITVTDSVGNTATDSVLVTVNPLPAITTTPPPSICVGGSTVLSASGASTYAWTPCTNLTPCTGSTVTANPTVSTPYTVTGTDANGCSATASVLVTVNPLPIVVTPPAPVICSGGTVGINLSGGTYYHWMPQTGIISATGPDSSSVSVTLTSTTTYTVTGYSAEGCSATTSFTVTVNPNPVAVITPSGNTVFCVGGSVDLTASPAGTYVWSDSETLQTIHVTQSGTFTVTVTDSSGCTGVSAPQSVTVNPLPTATITPNGPVAFCQGGQVILTAAGGTGFLWSNSSISSSVTVNASGTFTVTVTDNNNCSNTASQAVTVYPLPVAVITPDGPLAFCQGGQVILTASGGTSYLWSDASTSANLTVNTSGTYTVTVTDANSCTGNTSSSVIVHPLPVANITPAGPVTICTGNPALLSANTGSGYSYQLYLNSTVITGATTDQYNATVTGTYSVVITDANSCTAVSNNVQVNLGIGPAVTINAPPTTGCLANTIYIGYGPQDIQLCAQASAGAVSYLWSTGATTQCININTAGTYTVTAYDINGCPSPTPATLAQPINVIDIRCGHGLKKIILCHVPEGNQGNPQTLCIAPAAVPPHLSLHRYDCLGPCSLYYRQSEIVDVENFFVSPHPNPFSNGFNLTILSASSNSVTVNIHNMLGQVVETYSDVTEETLIGTKLNAGIYFAEVIQDGNCQMIQIVKSE